MIDVLYFALKAFIIFGSLAGLILIIGILVLKASGQQKQELEIIPLHEKYQDYGHFLKSHYLSKSELKEEDKKHKKAEKEKEKKKKSSDDSSAEANSETVGKKVFVIDFEGDIHASQVAFIREEITAILQVAKKTDEVVIRLESPGGVVHGYGHAASQLDRIRQKGIPLTACIDEVAASGGYMMAAVADKIIAAPLAIVGSIGVIAQVPNFHKILKKYDVDYKEYTAGEYKRTVSLLGEITPQGEEHFKQKLNDTHVLFKSHVQKYRPQVNLVDVATGDHWFGEEALRLKLVDQLSTSDDYLLSFPTDTQILQVKYEEKRPWSEKFTHILGKSLEKAANRVIAKLEKRFFY